MKLLSSISGTAAHLLFIARAGLSNSGDAVQIGPCTNKLLVRTAGPMSTSVRIAGTNKTSGLSHGKSDAIPRLIFAAAFAALWLASVMGSWLRRRNSSAEDEQHEDDLGIILGATLTLLALIIGFSISMASSRYDQRKNLEEAEANAIGTEMLRADLLPAADPANVRSLLSAYLDQRILFYINRDDARRPQIDQSTSQLQAALWDAVRGPATAQPTPVMALVLAGMNDVINSQG